MLYPSITQLASLFSFDFKGKKHCYESMTLFIYKEKDKLVFYLAGIIMGATELKGPTKYKYSDLKAATQNLGVQNPSI